MTNNELTEKLLKQYLVQKNNVNSALENNWYIANSQYGGRGVFAKNDLENGTVVAIDTAIIEGPRAASNVVPCCVVCYSNQNSCKLRVCTSQCGLPICSENCESSEKHIKLCSIITQWMQKNNHTGFPKWSIELLRCVSSLNGLTVSSDERDLINILQCNKGPQHGFELRLLDQLNLAPSSEQTEFLERVCQVLDTNAFEILIKTNNGENHYSLRGLFPLGALLNHSCIPITTHVFNSNNQMVLKTTKQISKDEELTTTYTNLIWGNVARRHNLYMTKHFWCRCPRCSDPTEFGTNLSGLYCTKRPDGCEGILLPKSSLKIDSKWECNLCHFEISPKKIGMIQSVMGSLVGILERGNCEEICEFVQNRLSNLIPECNQLAFDFKYRLIGMIGYENNFKWNDLSIELLNFKEQMCRDLLTIVARLNLGDCQRRGMLLRELHFTLEEKNRRCEDFNVIRQKESEECKKAGDKILNPEFVAKEIFER